MVVLSVLVCASSFLPRVHGIVTWTSLGGATLSSPAVTGIAGSRVDVVVRGADNRIYHKYYKSVGGWSGWTSLGGATNDQPAVAIAGAYLHVVVRGTDNGIYHKKFILPDGPWDVSWTNVGGATLSTPALATDGSSLFLFVRGTDNGIYYKFWASSWEASWSKVPGATNDIPAIAILQGYMHLVVRGTDNGIYHNTADGYYWPPTWYGWTRILGATISPPTLEAVTSPSNYLNLVVRGTDNGIYYNRWASSWLASWINLGGATIDRPDLYANTPGGTLLLFVRGADNGVYYKTMVLSTYVWGSWTQTPGATSSGPTMEAGLVVVRGMDNGIYCE